MSRTFVSDARLASAPRLPVDRPPTRREVWAYAQHVHGDRLDEAELKLWAQTKWVENYVYAVNVGGWDKPPDWVEGEPAPPAACPSGPFPALTNWNEAVYGLLEKKGAS